jgi:hypothetical protein
MKPIRLTHHAKMQAIERGATEEEIQLAILQGSREPVQKGRMLCRYNTNYANYWGEKYYQVKQVAPVIKEESEEIVLITVYTFYF